MALASPYLECSNLEMLKLSLTSFYFTVFCFSSSILDAFLKMFLEFFEFVTLPLFSSNVCLFSQPRISFHSIAFYIYIILVFPKECYYLSGIFRKYHVLTTVNPSFLPSIITHDSTKPFALNWFPTLLP